MSLPVRPPSTQWEQVPLPIGGWVWCWFQPQGAPQDLLVQIPPEVQHALTGCLTMRMLVAALGIEANHLEGWVINGYPVSLTSQTVGYLDQPLPHVITPVTLRMRTLGEFKPAQVSTATAPSASPLSKSSDHELLYQHIEADWQMVEQIEANMQQLRKQLNAMAGKLKSLNRDLSTEEFQAADSQDKRDWQDIRRWLRDAAAGVSRSIREFDVGDLSAAGGRGRFEELYRTIIQPRTSHANLQALAGEFEMYRKLCQNQFQKMQTAVSAAARDGDQRASQFLTRLAAKARVQRGKR